MSSTAKPKKKKKKTSSTGLIVAGVATAAIVGAGVYLIAGSASAKGTKKPDPLAGKSKGSGSASPPRSSKGGGANAPGKGAGAGGKGTDGGSAGPGGNIPSEGSGKGNGGGSSSPVGPGGTRSPKVRTALRARMSRRAFGGETAPRFPRTSTTRATRSGSPQTGRRRRRGSTSLWTVSTPRESG